MPIINEKIFKAYDIRGAYPEDINKEAVFKIVSALGRFFGKGKVVLCHDARLSCEELYKSALKALEKIKRIEVISVGLSTTPMLYFLTARFKARGGIMITASHSPKNHNGLKVVKFGAEPMSGTEIRKLVG
jgi:phosphomannomutase